MVVKQCQQTVVELSLIVAIVLYFFVLFVSRFSDCSDSLVLLCSFCQ